MQRSTAGSLRLGFGGLVALLVAAAGVRLVLSESVTGSFDRTLVEIETSRAANIEVLQALTDVETGIRGYQLTRDRKFLEPTTDGQRRFPVAIRAAIANAPDEKTRTLLQEERALADAWLRESVAPLATASPAELRQDTDLATRGKQRFDAVRRANAAVGDALDVRKRAALASIRSESRVSEAVALGLSVLSTLLVLFLAWRTSRLLLGPLNGMRQTLIRLGRGERSARAPETGPPEIRQVIRTLNELCDETDLLRASEQRRMHMETLSHEIGSRVRESLERRAVLDEVVDALGAALDVDRVYVQLIVRGQPGPIERQWHRPELAPLAADVPRTLTEPAVVPRSAPGTRTLVCDDVAADPSVSAEFVAATGAGAYMKTTFGRDDEIFGVVVLVRVGQQRRWLPDEIALVQAVAADLGLAFRLVRLYEHEREVAERLRDVDQQKTDFIATVSHELRTPLTSVLGYLEVLTSGDQGPIPDRQMKSLRIIERNAERLGEMVADLLTLSRIEVGAFSLVVGEVRASEIVAGALETVGPVAAGVGLRVDTDVPADLWLVGDRNQLQRIVVNLVGNAVKFSSPGGEIHIEARPHAPNSVQMSVTDTGTGIPEHEQQGLFEPFQRGSNAVANATQGPGLGLAVVRAIVEQHHGRVELASELGQGTRVTVVLPRGAAAEKAEPAAPARTPTVAG